jgi:hypothetical protein
VLRLVLRRAWVQRLVLSVVVLLVAVAATLMGVCSLLLGATATKALHEQTLRLEPHEVDVTAYVVGVPASDVEETRRQARRVVQHVLDPLRPSLVSTATSRMRRLDEDRLGYLATTDALAGQVTLTSGRQPANGTSPPLEALAPDAAARNLHLRLGARVVLGSETGLGARDRPVTVVVVGTYRPSSRAAWTSDPLSGAGFAPAYSDGSVTAPTYGPFMVADAAFLATGSNVNGLRVDAHPTLRVADDASLSEAAASLSSASGLLSGRVGGSADVTRIASELPDTLSRLHVQQSTTRSAVMVVLLLGTTLALAGLLLAARLVADIRTDERELLTALGLGRGQQVGFALLEAALLAGLATVVAVPAAAVTHSLMTQLPDLAAAGLSQGPAVTAASVLTALAGAALLALVLTLAPLLAWETGRLPARRRAVARRGVDVLLLVVAAVSWWQLRSRPSTAAGSDVLLTLAPVLWLTAVSLVAVRCLPSLVEAAAAAGSRSRALLPLSLHPVALRLSAGTALVLLATASAAATFGVALHATWQRAQADQADLRVGTGLSLGLASPPTAVDAAAIKRQITATSGSGTVLSPVTSRSVALGRFVGDEGNPPQLLALDTRHAAALLHGRLEDGATWSGVGHDVAPTSVVPGLQLPPGGRGVELSGRAPASAPVTVTPIVVVQDATGVRSTLAASAVPLDGRSHPVLWSAPPAPGQRVVAVDLSLAGSGVGDPGDESSVDVSVELRIPGRDSDAAVAGWQARQLGRDSPVVGESVAVRQAGDAVVLTTRARLNLAYLLYSDGEILATAFDPPAAVPVAVSQQLIDTVGTKVGGSLSATVDDTALELRVVRVVPTVPSAPGRIAVLADVDTLSRTLIGAGRLDPVVDAFWVSRSSARTDSALQSLKLGEVTTRDQVADQLAEGPMQVTVPLAYLTLVVSGALLLLAGAALLVSADPRRRSEEVARLRALGLTRGGARRLLLAEHGALLVPLVLTGLIVGAAAALALGTNLIRSDQGAAPVPRVLLVWPWGQELLVAGGLLLASLLVAAVAAVVQVHRSDTAQLRTGE